jgi:hypothetical protein
MNRAFNARMATGVMATAALLLAVMTSQTAVSLMANSEALSREVELDENTIAKTANINAAYGIYRYRVPMRGYAAGFILAYASVPRFTEAYRAGTVFSAYQSLPRKVRSNPGYVVVDKRSYPTRDSVQSLPYQPIDEIRELRTVWLVLRHLPLDPKLLYANEWQRRLVEGARLLVNLPASACGNIPQPLTCGATYSYRVVERGEGWCEKVRKTGSNEAFGDRCTSDPEKSLITLAGAPFSFNDGGELFFDNHHVGQLEEIPPPNEWQTRLMQGEKIRVALSERGCGIVPLPLACGTRYSLQLTRKEDRWCETISQTGSTNDLGGRCTAIPDDSIISLVGAPFTFNGQGELFYHNHHVGQLEKIPPPNEWQSRFMRGERILTAFSSEGCSIIPAGLPCPAQYIVTLTQLEGRWCETSHQVGGDIIPGVRCTADPEESIFTLLGAPFSFTTKGEILYDGRLVGHLELPSPPNQ